MSEPGETTPPAPPITDALWRDRVTIVETLARPFSIYAAAIAVAVGPFTVADGEMRVAALGIAAGVVGGVSYFRSKDKQAEMGR